MSSNSSYSNPTESEEEEQEESYPDKISRIMNEYGVSGDQAIQIIRRVVETEYEDLTREQAQLQQEIDFDNNNNRNNDNNTFNASLNLKDHADIEIIHKDGVIQMNEGKIVYSSSSSSSPSS